MRSLTLASLLILFSLMFAMPSYASGQSQADDMGFGISPVAAADPAVTASGYFIYKVQGSTMVTGSVLLQNPSSVPLTIQLGAVDAQTAQTGGSAFATSEVTPTGVATWLRFAESSVTLPAGRQKAVDFTVTVPQTARPGQHLAGISAYVLDIDSTTELEQGGSGMGASVIMQMRYVIGVQVDIEGEWTPSLKIDSVAVIHQPSGSFIGVHMTNDGSIFLKPSGTIVLTDTSGKRALEQPIEMGTFVPGTDVTYPVRWPGELAAGSYQVRVSLDYDADGKEIYEGQLEVGPAKAAEDSGSAAATQVPSTIGGINPAGPSNSEIPSSSKPEATAQAEGGAGVWFLLPVGVGSILLALGMLMIPKPGKIRTQKPRVAVKGL